MKQRGETPSFAHKYYQMWLTSPSTLHKFYTSTATFKHSHALETSAALDAIPTLMGSDSIRVWLANNPMQDLKIDLDNGVIDGMRSGENCILIIVNGKIEKRVGDDPKPSALRFQQVFVLNKEANGKKFMVESDCFRFLEFLEQGAGAATHSEQVEDAKGKARDKERGDRDKDKDRDRDSSVKGGGGGGRGADRRERKDRGGDKEAPANNKAVSKPGGGGSAVYPGRHSH